MRADHGPVLNIFTRRVESGRTKTRLIPRLGAERAGELSRAMLDWTIDNAVAAWPGPVCVRVWPPGGIADVRRRPGVTVLAQSGADLGERMANVLEAAPASGAAVIGSDIPQVDGATLGDARRRLGAGRVLLGPAHDGGFWFIGARQFDRRLFDGVVWGGGNVLESVRDNGARLGIDFDLLAEFRDVDDYDDLCAVAAGFPALRPFTSTVS